MLGAASVGIGKPVVFALDVGGQTVVSQTLQLLRTELEAAMAICGLEMISYIIPHLVTRRPSASTIAPYRRSTLQQKLHNVLYSDSSIRSVQSKPIHNLNSKEHLLIHRSVLVAPFDNIILVFASSFVVPQPVACRSRQ